MNLENFNLVELSAQEVKEITGGWGFNLHIGSFSIVSYNSKRPSDSNWRTDFW